MMSKMGKTELDWVADCHDNPMYAAEHIVKLEQRIDELETSRDSWNRAANYWLAEYKRLDMEHIELSEHAVKNRARILELEKAVQAVVDYNKGSVIIHKPIDALAALLEASDECNHDWVERGTEFVVLGMECRKCNARRASDNG